MAGQLLRFLCLVTAVANTAGNLGLFLFYPLVFSWLHIPLPSDLFTFYAVLGFSFTNGLLAFLVWLEPSRSTRLLAIGIVSKGLYALMTLYFYIFHGLHGFWMLFGLWDAAFTLIFFLYLIHLLRPDLLVLNSGYLLPGVERPRTKKALLLYYSLSGNGVRAIAAVRRGLEAGGYACTVKQVEPVEQELFHFPFGSVWQFTRIMLRALFRIPVKSQPLGLLADHPYDLIVCESQTWMIGMSGPMEGVFLASENRAIFAGRDAAAINLCRGLWRRAQCQLITCLQRSGARVVGAQAYTNPGWEPARLLSLFIFLAAGKPDVPRWLKDWLLQSPYLDEAGLAELERFGHRLAARPIWASGSPATEIADESETVV
jgi:hypothetical protein